MEKIEPYENKNEKDKVESIYEQLKNIMKDKFQSIGAKTTTDRPYSDQNNDTSLAKVGNRTWYMNEAYNPISGESYAFTCWIADPKEGAVLDPSEFEKFGTPWEDKCKSVWQIHGSSRVGFQVQEIIENGNGKLGPRIVYTTKKDHVEVETGFDKDMSATSRISLEEFYSLFEKELNDIALEGKSDIKQEFKENTHKSVSRKDIVEESMRQNVALTEVRGIKGFFAALKRKIFERSDQ